MTDFYGLGCFETFWCKFSKMSKPTWVCNSYGLKKSRGKVYVRILSVRPGLIIIFVIVLTPCQKAQNELPLVSPFQRAIVCHQQTNIGGAKENSPGLKLGVLGQIIVIFVESEKNWDSIYFFFAPCGAFLLNFSGAALVANKAPEKSECLGPFWSLRNKIVPHSRAHFSIQIYFSALWVASLNMLWGLRTWIGPLA